MARASSDSEHPATEESPIQIGEFTFDLHRRGLFLGSERIHITAKPFDVLAYLVQRRGQVVSKSELLKAVWHGQQDENVVEQAIRQIRRALKEDKTSPRFIQTIPGRGYCFIGISGGEGRNPVEDEPRTPTLPEPQPLTLSASKHRRFGIVGLTIFLLAAAFAFRPTLPDPKLISPFRVTKSQTRILSPLLSDGVRLYYQRFDNGRYLVAEVAATGGQSITRAMGVANPELCDLSPDGSSLLIRDLIHSRNANEPVYIQSAAGGLAHRVGDILAYDAAWYPDGKHILYTDDGEVYTTDLDGKRKRRLFGVSGNAYWFRWSPDGRNVRFTVMDKETEVATLWDASADGALLHRLLPELNHPQCCGSWTPDGKFFVFQVRIENTFQVWARRESGSLFFRTNSRPVPLALGGMNYRGPLPSKDGSKLFMRTEELNGELVRYDSKSRQFISLLSSIPVRTAAFSRGGQWISYTTLNDNTLWRSKSDGTDRLQLTQGMQQTAMPRWSPDGSTIAFMGRQFGQDWGIFTVDSTGGETRLLCAANHDNGDPDWSPDGRRLVFGNEMRPPDQMAIYILNKHTCDVSTLPESKRHFSPRWSPDGRFIVAVHAGDQRLDLFEFASRKWAPLVRVPGGYPNWSHDSKYVYFLSSMNGYRVVFRVGVEDRRVEEVASLAPVERGSFLMGDWFGLSPDDSPMAVRNLSNEDIYSWEFEAR